MSPAEIVMTVVRVVDVLLALAPKSQQSEVLERLEAWSQRRRATIARHQAKLEAASANRKP